MSALAVPGFRRLFLAWTFSNFGDSALYLTMAMWAKDLTGSDSATGLVFLALGLPVFLSPLTGQLADRVSRKRLVVVTNALAAVVVLSLFAVESAAQMWLIYAVTFCYGLVGYVTSGAQSGLLKDLIADDQLAGANGALSTLDQGLRFLTPLAGAGLYVLFGGTGVAVLTAVMFAVAAAVAATLQVRETTPTPADQRERFWPELTAGVRHLRSQPALWRLTIVLALAVGVTGFNNTTTFAAIERGLGMGPEFFGVLASAQGAGAIAGGLTAAVVIRRFGEPFAVSAGLVLLGGGMATAVGTNAGLFAAGAAVAGAGVVWTVVAFVTLRQRLTPSRLQGRVSAATLLATNGPQMFATAVGAGLILSVDYRVIVVAASAVVLACAAVAALSRPAAATAATPPAREANAAVEPVH